MIEEARKKGVATEKAMWAGIDRVDEMLMSMKDEHPKEYEVFMRKTYHDLYGSHYNEEWAKKDIDDLEYTDKEGKKHYGAHWTKDEVVAATKDKTFPASTTPCDKWVAYNAAYADFCRRFSDSEILDIAYLFFFDDEDYQGSGKIWDYMCAMKV